MLKATLEDIMSEDIVTIKENATVGQAAHILLRFRINGILITKKNDRNNVVGLVTTTDLLRLIDRALSSPKNKLSRLSNIAKTPVLSVSTKNILKIQKGTGIKRVLAIMHKQNLHTIPVYEGNKLVGIVGRHDILNAAFA